jgi:hypothetical protein
MFALLKLVRASAVTYCVLPVILLHDGDIFWQRRKMRRTRERSGDGMT